MSRKLVLLLAVIFIFTAVGSAYSQTEDEIIAQYLKKAEKKHKPKVGFASVSFVYGNLPNNSDYNVFFNYANHRIFPGGPLDGIWNCMQFAGELGMMAADKFSFKVGFDYWMKLGSSVTGDYTFGTTFGPSGYQESFEVKSEIQVYGFYGGFDYFIFNPPDRDGIVRSISLRAGAGAGYYLSKWQIWEGAYTLNLSTETTEENVEPLKGSAPGVTAWIGMDYPVNLLGLLVGANVSYMYLNFTDVHSYNSLGEELYVTYSTSPSDRVELDFSGLRGKIELKRYFKW
jgi:hypothetical protein